MKRIFVATLLAVLLLVAAAFVASKSPVTKATPTVHADGGGVCSLATVAGNYGFTLTGTLILPTGGVPVAAIGRATLEVEGSVSGTEARNVGGGFADETFKGTFRVNPDCTGTTTVKFFDSESGNLVRTSALSILFDDNSNEIRFVQQSLKVPLPDGTTATLPVVITAEARKISPNSGN
jgi:hypothetical protein